MTSKILVLNGPNLNTLGIRQPEVYGTDTLADVVALCERVAAGRGVEVDCRQSNHEGEMIDWIHAARGVFDAIVINAGAWTHTSGALRDALVIPEVPIFEVHITNVHAREEWRHHSFISPIASGIIVGCGIAGYGYAIDRAADAIG
ncbi:type II 3-dehydroquinate dehydratase [Tsukamurella soli]|uniref:type II 3-dehydroquinate dehydratase n=1 Tax=Tsukamurella soli TaxID=644556 RepID=UPI0031E744FA